MKHKANSKAGNGQSSPAKGKGKNQQEAKDSKNNGGHGQDMVDLKDYPLRLPEFASFDLSKQVPRLHSVLRRSEQDGIGMEDLDALQLELEAMLSAAVVRKSALRQEAAILAAGGGSGSRLEKHHHHHHHHHAGGAGGGHHGQQHHHHLKGSSASRSSAGAATSTLARGPLSPGGGKRGCPGTAPSASKQGRATAKKFRTSGGKPTSSSAATEDSSTVLPAMPSVATVGSKVIGIPKVKSDADRNHQPTFDPLQNEQIRREDKDQSSNKHQSSSSSSSSSSLPKNETPSRFWAFVEPFCAPITPEDIKLLEDLIKTHGETSSDFYRVPKLGQHYSVRWAAEDMEYERSKGGQQATPGGGLIPGGGMLSATSNNDPGDNVAEAAAADKVLQGKRASNQRVTAGEFTEKTPFGELTQRLVAGLIEDNLMTSVEDSADSGGVKRQGSGEDASCDGVNGKDQLIKSLNIANPEALEARVKKELLEQGILDEEDDDATGGANEDKKAVGLGGSDEVLVELMRCQNELRAVSAHNLQQLKRLLKAAKEEMVRQELRNKLVEADDDVMDAYRKISAARSKKRPPSKKEREQAWKALKEREIILKQLESV